jgi:hypothetical protein
MSELFKKAVEAARALILSYAFLCDSRKEARFFSRAGKIGFVNAFCRILKLCRKTTQVELIEMFWDGEDASSVPSKQAFSEAREKIKPEAFETLFRNGAELGYSSADIPRFHDHRLCAIDGSTIAMENSKELLSFFHCAGRKASACTARASLLVDCFKGNIYDGIIDDYKTGERELALRHIKRLAAFDNQKSIVLFDRGYCSKALIAECFHLKIRFLMRIRDRWCMEIASKTPSGSYAELIYKGTTYRIRVIKLALPSGDIETLFTDIDFLTQEEFLALYAKRCKIETDYDVLKNKIQLENFSGKTVNAVKQDFFASLFIANLAFYAKIDTDTKIEDDTEKKDNKHKYQANINVLIGALRPKLIEVLLEPDSNQRDKRFAAFINLVARFRTPADTDRASPRKPPRQGKKFFISKKSCF